MVSQDFLQEYVEEAREHLQELEGSLLVLEREGTKKEEIGQIFRAAHSIKGASAYMGFEQLANLTHEMESFISEIQNNPRSVTHDEVSALLECVDFISRALGYLQEKGDEPPLPVSLMDNLHSVRTGKGVREHAESNSPPAPPELEVEPFGEDLIPMDLVERETGERPSEELVFESPRRDEESQEIQEDDQELFGIFLNSFQDLFSELTSVHPGVSPETVLSQAELEKAQDLIRRLIASSQYMDYTQIVGLLKELDDSLLQFHQAGLTDGYYYSQLLQNYGERFQRILPRLRLPFRSASTRMLPEELEAIQEEDEELFTIFMDSVHQHCSELSSLTPSTPDTQVPSEDCGKAQEIIRKMISSSQYMDYEQIVELLKEWEGSLLACQTNGELNGHRYLELLHAQEGKLHKMLPGLKAKKSEALEASQETGTTQEPGPIQEEDEELLTIFMDSFRQHIADLSSLTPLALETPLSPADFGKAQDLIRKLTSSSQYMDYEQLVEVLREWEESLLGCQKNGELDGHHFAELLQAHEKKMHELLPGLEMKEPETLDMSHELVTVQKIEENRDLTASREFEAGQELQTVQEEDEELYSIFLDSFREHFSELSSLSPLSRETPLASGDCRKAQELIRKLISSSQYMDYEQIVNVLREWDESLLTLHENGELDGHHYLELLQAHEERLHELLPGLKMGPTISASEGELRSDEADREDERASSKLEELPAPEEALPEEAAHEQALIDVDRRAVEAWEIREKLAESAGKTQAKKARVSTTAEDSASAVTLRVDAQKVDQLLNQVGELVVTRSEFIQTAASFRDMLRELASQGKLSKQEVRKLRSFSFRLNESTQTLGRVANDLQNSVMRIRMLPISHLFQRFPRVVRDQALKIGKRVDLIVEGGDTEIDKRVLETMNDPLVQLLRNAIAHGIESPEERLLSGKPEAGGIRLAAYHEGDYVIIEVEDDGRGIDTQKLKGILQKRKGINIEQMERLSDHEIMYAIFLPGVSTHDRVDGTAGRGVGLDVVKENLERMNGTIEVESVPGAGTRFTIRIPLTVAIIRALMVKSADHVFALPLSSVSEIVRYEHDNTHTIEGFRVTSLRGRTIPLLNLSQLLNMPAYPSENAQRFVIIVSTSFREVGLVVDSLMGEREVVIKSIEDDYHDFDGFSGATILGDGTVSLILDVSALLRTLKTSLHEHPMAVESYAH